MSQVYHRCDCGKMSRVPQAEVEIDRLQAIVGKLIEGIDEHGGIHWRNPMIYTAPCWEQLRRAVAAAEASVSTNRIGG